jgi:hypothetical protein
MIRRNKISLAEFGKMRADIHRIADQVASGNVMAAVFITCDHQGHIGGSGMIDGGSPELIDEMVYYAKTVLFESHADQQEWTSHDPVRVSFPYGRYGR